MATKSDSQVAVESAQADLDHVVEVAQSVREKERQFAAYAIIAAATARVNKLVDPTSSVGRILLATLLDQAAWKVGTGHGAFEALRAAAWTLNPKK